MIGEDGILREGRLTFAFVVDVVGVLLLLFIELLLGDDDVDVNGMDNDDDDDEMTCCFWRGTNWISSI